MANPIYLPDGSVYKTLGQRVEDQVTPFNQIDRRRGISVYNSNMLMAESGRTKDGNWLKVTYEMPWFVLTITERLDLYKLCAPVFAVISGRMNRISGMEWKIK